MIPYHQQFPVLYPGELPYSYQERVADAMWARSNVVVHAPTGTGKTVAAVAPFLLDRARTGARRLIYALPLRTLVQGIYRELCDLIPRCDGSFHVTIQTGEQPGDPFFTLGDIVVTTYDQVLSGMLCQPYGRSPRLHNVNAAAVAGNVVVFDEFHLMEPSRAFLTALACLSFFERVTRSVWMTATATTPLVHELRETLDPVEIEVSADELRKIPAVHNVRRCLVKEGGELTAADVIRQADQRNIVVVNRVSRAQQLYGEIVERLAGRSVEVRLLHARFFARDRRAKQEWLHEWFGPKKKGPAVLVATQVIEAGLNLTCDHLHTELCPMNALVQRAGRCARFKHEEGTVHVYRVADGKEKPYEKAELSDTWNCLPREAELKPEITREWVDTVHSASDRRQVENCLTARIKQCTEAIQARVEKRDQGGISDLIRSGSDTIRVLIHKNPKGVPPRELDGVSVYRNSLDALVSQRRGPVWLYDPDSEGLWRNLVSREQLQNAYVISLHPDIARYTAEVGLELGFGGEIESPKRDAPERPGYRPFRREAWSGHTCKVMETCLKTHDEQAFDGSLLVERLNGTELRQCIRTAGFLHDLGKLQAAWQEWAKRYQKTRDPAYLHKRFLAHTDFDAENPFDRECAKRVGMTRPRHSTASAYYGQGLVGELAAAANPTHQTAILTAVVSHHGGWIDRSQVGPLHRRWHEGIHEVEPGLVCPSLPTPTPADLVRFEQSISDSLNLEFDSLWPVAAYLMRTLRLSDWSATEEGSGDG